MKNRIVHLATEFVMVFLGVLLAFLTSNWAEREKDRRYLTTIVDNLVQDVRNDSIQVVRAINALKMQRDSLEVLVFYLGQMNFRQANPHLYWTYFSYSAFDPSTETFESLVFGGDMKLVQDLNTLRSMKDLDHINKKLKEVHDKYSEATESFRNSFVCHYKMEDFDFALIPPKSRIEFWNRVNFLKANVKAYHDILVVAQVKYNEFLAGARIL